jgi:hypothetical protein
MIIEKLIAVVKKDAITAVRTATVLYCRAWHKSRNW